jgi:hypothetical protein
LLFVSIEPLRGKGIRIIGGGRDLAQPGRPAMAAREGLRAGCCTFDFTIS